MRGHHLAATWGAAAAAALLTAGLASGYVHPVGLALAILSALVLLHGETRP